RAIVTAQRGGQLRQQDAPSYIGTTQRRHCAKARLNHHNDRLSSPSAANCSGTLTANAAPPPTASARSAPLNEPFWSRRAATYPSAIIPASVNTAAVRRTLTARTA